MFVKSMYWRHQLLLFWAPNIGYTETGYLQMGDLHPNGYLRHVVALLVIGYLRHVVGLLVMRLHSMNSVFPGLGYALHWRFGFVMTSRIGICSSLMIWFCTDSGCVLHRFCNVLAMWNVRKCHEKSYWSFCYSYNDGFSMLHVGLCIEDAYSIGFCPLNSMIRGYWVRWPLRHVRHAENTLPCYSTR